MSNIDTPLTPDAADLLRDAADLIDRVGLWKQNYWPGWDDERSYVPGDPVCLLGALIQALPGSPDDDPELALLDEVPRIAVRALVVHLRLPHAGLSVWNDDDTRTVAEVAAAFRGAAALTAGASSGEDT